MKKTSPTLDSFKAVRRAENSSQDMIDLCKGVSLMRARVHEVEGMSADGFAASLIAGTQSDAMWIGRHNDIFSLSPLAFSRYFHPTRLVLTQCLSRKEILWAADQALRSKAFDVVIIQLQSGPNFNESRRLQIAAEVGQATGLVMIGSHAQSSAAQTRWHCTTLAHQGAAANDHIWRWECTKNKSGRLGTWHVRWKEDGYATGHVDMVS